MFFVCVCQGRNEDLDRELSKLNEKDVKLEEDKNKIAEQYKQEYMQLKTDRDATITQLQGFLCIVVVTVHRFSTFLCYRFFLPTAWLHDTHVLAGWPQAWKTWNTQGFL